MLPQEPVMLLSYVNMKLRDCYRDLNALCEDLDLNSEELTEKLAGIEYFYNAERNQFI